MNDVQQPPFTPATRSRRYWLWVEGVGGYLLCVGSRFTVGGADGGADVALLGHLQREHASLEFGHEDLLIDPSGPVTVNDREIDSRYLLRHGDRMRLGRQVELTIRKPSSLSRSVCLFLSSGHRPSLSVDGVLLMAETCLLGPEIENHVNCPDWPGRVILYDEGGRLMVRSPLPLVIESTVQGQLEAGATITGDTWRFRIEPVKDPGWSK